VDAPCHELCCLQATHLERRYDSFADYTQGSKNPKKHKQSDSHGIIRFLMVSPFSMTSAAGVDQEGVQILWDIWDTGDTGRDSGSLPLRFFLQGAPFEHASPRLVQDAASAIQASSPGCTSNDARSR
jgi:hypothetical protein